MINFTFENKTKIIFGKGMHRSVGEYVKEYSSNILLHYGSGSVKKTGLLDEVVQSLKDNGVSFTLLGGVVPNPRLALVRQGIDLCREQGIDFILAVGGGSVIDSAKAIAIGVPAKCDVWDFYTAKSEPKSSLGVGCILTIPAAGSESSSGSVITNEELKLKRSCGNEVMRPIFSVINPELCFTLPKNQIANGVCDMMSHIMERYFTPTPNTEFTDALCESALRVIMKNAKILMDNNRDYDAWAEICLAGNVAHNGLLGVGRAQDWGSHDMEHELSGIYDIPHGAGLAIVTPAWMKYIYKNNLGIFTQFAVNVMGVEHDIRNLEKTALAGILRLEEFFSSISLPVRLSEVGIGKENLRKMAEKSMYKFGENFRPLGGLQKLYAGDVEQIYTIAL